MDYGAADTAGMHEAKAPSDHRGAERFTSLIRAAKLISSQGEFVCVIRDVSASGISLRMFHDLPVDDRLALELQNGECYELKKVREMDREASFTFRQLIAVERLIHETWNFPKRQLRINVAMPLTVSTISCNAQATTENMSQQGCRFICDTALAIDQTVRLESPELPEIRAKVRWRKDDHYGLVFDNTFTLREFAVVAARLQCPSLISC